MDVHNRPVKPYYLSPYTGDEVELIALFGIIWRGKWVVLAVIAFCLLVSGIYLWFTPKQYEISAKLYPIDAISMAIVAPGGGGEKLGYGVNIQDAEVFYRATIDSLDSFEYQRKFWISQSDFDPDVQLEGAALDEFLDFKRSLHLSMPEGDKPVVIRIIGDDPLIIADHLRLFLDYVAAEVAAKSISSLLRAVEVSIEQIDQAILQARIRANAEISDRIVSVAEALEIATSLGIEEAEFDRLANVEVTLFNSRQYLLGRKALTSELQALQRRRDKDAFVPGLRELQAAKASLLADQGRINRNIADFRPFVYPDSISPPLRPAGPKSVLIMVMALVFGLLFGIIVVFIRHGIHSYEVKHKVSLAAQS